MDKKNPCNCEDGVCVDADLSLWEMSFSSEFDFDDSCAKFKPCYIARPEYEACETEATELEGV